MVFYCRSTFMCEIFTAKVRSYLLLFLSTPANKTATDEANAPAANQGMINNGAHLLNSSDDVPNHTGVQ